MISSTAVAVDVKRWMAFNFKLKIRHTQDDSDKWLDFILRLRCRLTVYWPSVDSRIPSIDLHSQFLLCRWLWRGSSPSPSHIVQAFLWPIELSGPKRTQIKVDFGVFWGGTRERRRRRRTVYTCSDFLRWFSHGRIFAVREAECPLKQDFVPSLLSLRPPTTLQLAMEPSYFPPSLSSQPLCSSIPA